MSEYGSGRKTAFIVVLALFVIECAFLVKNEKYVKATGLIIAVGLSDLALAVYILISRLA